MSKTPEWRKFAEDNNLSNVEFQEEVLVAAMAILSMQLDASSEEKFGIIRGDYYLSIENIDDILKMKRMREKILKDLVEIQNDD